VDRKAECGRLNLTHVTKNKNTTTRNIGLNSTLATRRPKSECKYNLRVLGRVVRNRVEIWTFLPSQILLGRPFQNLYPRYHACLPARRPVKFREVNPTNPKVIGTHVLNFKPNLF